MNCPPTPTALSPGTGPVDIYDNLIQANLGNDDGGGLRFLMAGNPRPLMNVYNNMIVNNVSTHEGGGIGINDTPNVRIYNNTIMKNLTTATAVTSNGSPAPAGLSTSQNSALLQATLPGGAPIFSNPLLFNNIFWDNRAGTRAGADVTGLGAPGDASPINYWDLGVADGTGQLSPTNSVLQSTTGTIASGTNSSADPQIITPYDVSVDFAVWRNNPNFVGAIMVALEVAANNLGDYHLQATSPAVDLGAASKAGVNAPSDDIDGDVRPNGGFDSGADELANGAPPPPPPPSVATPVLYFSTGASEAVPGVAGPYDDADIYAWNSDGSYSRIFDGSAVGLPGNADIDALQVIDSDTFYMSFIASNTSVPTLGQVQDEDVVRYDAGTWSIFFDGTGAGLGNSNGEDVDAFHLFSDGRILVSTIGSNNVGIGRLQDEDILQCVPNNAQTPVSACTWSLYFDGSDVNLHNNGGEDVNGAAIADNGDIYLTTLNGFNVNGLTGNDEDVFVCNSPTTGNNTSCNSFSMFFDGSAHSFGNGNNNNMDAISLPGNGITIATVERTAFLDVFNVANGPLPASWAGDVGINNYRVRRSEAQTRAGSGAIWWNESTFGPNQEAFLSFTNLRPSTNRVTRWQGLLLKVNGGHPDSANASAIDVRYASNKGVQVRTKAAGAGWVVQAEIGGVTYTIGDKLRAEALADGTVNVYKNADLIGSVNVLSGANPWPVANAQAGGAIGVTYNFSNGRFDYFGGGDITPTVTVNAAMTSALGQVAEPDVRDTEEDTSDLFDLDNLIFMPLVSD